MNKQLENIKIARISTIPFFVFTQLREQLETLVRAGSMVSIVASDDEMKDSMSAIQGCEFCSITIARKISFVSDVLSIFKLWKLFREKQYHIIHSTTPKAGLLCAIAAKLSNQSICIHTFTGQAWVTMTGIKRMLVKNSDRLIAFLNPYSYTDSASQREFLIQNKIIPAEKIKVIGSGSLAGVDTRRFNLNNFSEAERLKIKASLGLDLQARIIIFIGRMNKEKGIIELFDAMKQLVQKEKETYLLMVGPFEEGIEQEVRSYAQQHLGAKVIFTGFHPQPEQFMAISTVLCLPSYREGFGTVVIEAGAMELPVIGTDIYGLKDAVIDGETGILVPPRDALRLSQALAYLLSNEDVRKRMGIKAKERVQREFDSHYFNQLLIDEYRYLLDEKAKNTIGQ